MSAIGAPARLHSRHVRNGLRVGLEAIAAGSGIEEGAGGARGFFEGMIPEMAADSRISELVIYAPSWYSDGGRWTLPTTRVVRCAVPKGRPLRVAYEQLALPLHAVRDRLDVLFSTGNYRPLAYRGANVVALHAIQHFLLGDDIGGLRARYLEFAVPRSVRSADMTIAVSETLRLDSIKLFGLDPNRIAAVPLGPPPWVEQLLASTAGNTALPHRLADGRPYVMCISRLYSLKNHQRLIEAFALLLRQHELPHQLLIVGGDADLTAADLEKVAFQAGVSDRVMLLGRMPQSDVAGLYAGATAIAYPSLYETFGHPVLEAFATGTPLITSSRGATAEIAGGAARLVDPENIDDIAAGLGAVLTDDELRGRMIAAGRQRVADFSWSRFARGAIDVLEEAVARRRASQA